MNNNIVCKSCNNPNLVFVFGANEAFYHGAGAARHAADFHNAKFNEGPFYGLSYGIPTKSGRLKTLSLNEIKKHVDIFLNFARVRTDLAFYVTKIGTGLAGYKNEDIAPMFKEAPTNCIFDEEWEKYIYENSNRI